MPVYNRLKQIGAGVGDNIISIDKGSFFSGAFFGWLEDDVFLFTSSIYNWALCKYDGPTGVVTILAGSGANFASASQGRYAAQGGSTYANFTIVPGSVLNLVGSDNRGASKNGVMALCDTRECTSFSLYSPNGTWVTIPAIAYGLCIIDEQSAIWNGGSHNYPLNTAIPLINQKFVRIGNEDWIIGWNDQWGLVATINGSTNGYILETRPIAFNHDAVSYNGELYVCWAENQAETPDSIQEVLVDRKLPRTSFIPPDPNPEPPDPIPPDPEPEPEPPQPEPEPEPPNGVDYMLAAYGPVIPAFAPGTEHDNGNGTISVQKPNGKWLCVTPDGHVEERDTPGGLWESFKRGRGCIIAERDGGDRGPQVFVLAIADTL